MRSGADERAQQPCNTPSSQAQRYLTPPHVYIFYDSIDGLCYKYLHWRNVNMTSQLDDKWRQKADRAPIFTSANVSLLRPQPGSDRLW